MIDVTPGNISLGDKLDHIAGSTFTAQSMHRSGRNTHCGEKLSASATRAIKQAVAFIQKKTAAELSALTHEPSRSWINAREGQPLDIYIDLIPDDEFARRERALDALHRELRTAWK